MVLIVRALSHNFVGKNEKGQMRLSRRAVLMRDSGGAAPSSSAVEGEGMAASTTTTAVVVMSPSVAAVAVAEAAYDSG